MTLELAGIHLCETVQTGIPGDPLYTACALGQFNMKRHCIAPKMTKIQTSDNQN